MITYLIIVMVQSVFLALVAIVKVFVPGVAFTGLTDNLGFCFAVSLIDRVIGWNFLINSISSAILIIAVIKMVKLIIGVFSKGQ